MVLINTELQTILLNETIQAIHFFLFRSGTMKRETLSAH